MNIVSIFLYLAEILGNLQIFMFMCALACALGLFINAMVSDSSNGRVKFYLKTWICVGVVCGFIAAILPSSETVYLIAASELGQIAIETPEAKELFDSVYKTVMKKLENI